MVADSVTPGTIDGIRYVVSENKIYLANDAGTSWGTGYAPGSAHVLSNTYAKVDCASATATPSGNTLTLSGKIAFKIGALGHLTTYLYAKDTYTNTGWVSKGSWDVVVAKPTEFDAVTQSRTVIRLTWANNNAASNALTEVYISDNATTWPNIPIVSLGNSYTVWESTQLAQNTKYYYKLRVKIGTQYSEWTAVKDATTLANNLPQTGTITPASGSAGIETWTNFTATFSDGDGTSDLTEVRMVADSVTPGTIDGIRYVVSENKIYLANDAGTSWGTGYRPGTAHVLSNTYAKVDCASATATPSGNTLTLSGKIAFKIGALGHLTTYLRAKDTFNVDTGWVSKGTWDVTQ
jgi:hypothetical protein